MEAKKCLIGAQGFCPQTNGEISTSITQSWTEQALECYSIKSDCKKCSLAKGSYSFKCQMPRIVDILLNSAGKPACNMI